MLRTFDPFRELERLAETAFNPANFGVGTATIAYDLVQYEDRYELFADLPGVDPSTIDLTVDGRDLTLTAERHFAVPEGARLTTAGRVHGTYKRVFHLSERLDAEHLTASYDSGVLSIVIPLAAAAKPRKVHVTVAHEPTTNPTPTAEHTPDAA